MGGLGITSASQSRRSAPGRPRTNRAVWTRNGTGESKMKDSERRTGCLTLAGVRPTLGRSCAGFTLIEVLVAAVVLAIGLVGVSSMVYYGVLSHQKSAHYTIAGQKAMQEMERIRDTGYLGAIVDATHFPSPTYTIVDSGTVGFSVPELTNGQGTITIAEDTEAQAINPATGQPYQNMKRVTVTIGWGGSRRSSGAYNLATLIANRP